MTYALPYFDIQPHFGTRTQKVNPPLSWSTPTWTRITLAPKDFLNVTTPQRSCKGGVGMGWGGWDSGIPSTSAMLILNFISFPLPRRCMLPPHPPSARPPAPQSPSLFPPHVQPHLPRIEIALKSHLNRIEIEQFIDSMSHILVLPIRPIPRWIWGWEK